MWEKVCIWLMRIGILAATVFGAVRETNVIWQLGDIGVGLLAWINVIALLILSPKAILALKDYEGRMAAGENDPRYEPSGLGIEPGVWEEKD